jgi:hypothetical protein
MLRLWLDTLTLGLGTSPLAQVKAAAAHVWRLNRTGKHEIRVRLSWQIIVLRIVKISEEQTWQRLRFLEYLLNKDGKHIVLQGARRIKQ